MPECDCAETRYVVAGEERRIFHPLHDCHYVKERNTLIPAAEAAAQVKNEKGEWVLNSRRFIETMDRMWRERQGEKKNA